MSSAQGLPHAGDIRADTELTIATAFQILRPNPALQCELNGPHNCSGLFRKGRGNHAITESR